MVGLNSDCFWECLGEWVWNWVLTLQMWGICSKSGVRPLVFKRHRKPSPRFDRLAAPSLFPKSNLPSQQCSRLSGLPVRYLTHTHTPNTSAWNYSTPWSLFTAAHLKLLRRPCTDILLPGVCFSPAFFYCVVVSTSLICRCIWMTTQKTLIIPVCSSVSPDSVLTRTYYTFHKLERGVHLGSPTAPSFRQKINYNT